MCNASVHAKRRNCGSQAPPRVHSRTAGPAQKSSTTLSMYCYWRNAMVTGPRESESAPRQECRRRGPITSKTSCTVGSRLFPTTAHDQLDLHKNIDHLVNVLQQGKNDGLLNSKTMGIRASVLSDQLHPLLRRLPLVLSLELRHDGVEHQLEADHRVPLKLSLRPHLQQRCWPLPRVRCVLSSWGFARGLFRRAARQAPHK